MEETLESSGANGHGQSHGQSHEPSHEPSHVPPPSPPSCGNIEQAHDHLRSVDPSLYEELRVIAARALRGESRRVTPGTTSLVHEIWLRLARSDRNPVNDQQHLLALASLVARRALVDDARTRKADRRGGGTLRPRELPEENEASTTEPSTLIALDELLTRLAKRHPRQAKALEMRIFGGISPEHIGLALDISATQAKRDVAFARAWLAAHEDTGDPPASDRKSDQ